MSTMSSLGCFYHMLPFLPQFMKRVIVILPLRKTWWIRGFQMMYGRVGWDQSKPKGVGTMPSLSDQRRAQLRRSERLITIFLDRYRFEGPAELLDLVHCLSATYVNLSVIADRSILPSALSGQGDILVARYELDCDLNALQESIGYYKRALRLSHHSHDVVEARVGLAFALFHRQRNFSRDDDCLESMQHFKQARTVVRQGSDEDEMWLWTIMGLVQSSSSTGGIVKVLPGDLIEILSNLRKMPREKLPRFRYVRSLITEAFLCWTLFQLTMNVDPTYIHTGLQAAKCALSLCAESAIVLRHEVIQQLFHLNFEASYFETLPTHHAHVAHLGQQLMASSLSARNTNVRWHSLYCWANAVRGREDANLEALEENIKALKQVASMCPRSHASKPPVTNQLINMLLTYYENTGRVSALDEINSVYLASPQHYLLTARYYASNIAECLLQRAQLTDDETAKVLIGQAMDLCRNRKNAPGYAQFHADGREQVCLNLQMIRASQMMRLRCSSDESHDLLTAPAIVELGQQIVTNLGYEPPHIRMKLILAQVDALLSQARSQHHTTSLVMAEKLLEELAGDRAGIPEVLRVLVLTAQANALVVRSDVVGPDNTVLSNAWMLYEQAVTLPISGQARDRFQTSLKWAACALDRGCPAEAFRAYGHAIDVLPEVVYKGEDVIGRLEALRQVNGLAASAAATALTNADISAAVDFLERSRGIMWLQTHQARAPQLQLLSASVRDEFLRVSHELEKADRLQWKTRRCLAEELDLITEKIRALPSHSRFLRPPLQSEINIALREKNSYAVVIIPNTDYCDVILFGNVIEGERSHLRLGTVKEARLRELARQFNMTCSLGRSMSPESFGSARKIKKSDLVNSSISQEAALAVLSELWVSLVQPIITHLNIMSQTTSAFRQRVWWCPVGVLGSLPIHAAGNYAVLPQDHVGNYVLSSYTPTLTALYRLISEQTFSEDPDVSVPNVLVVGHSATTGLASLPYVQEEVQLIREIVGSNNSAQASTADHRGMSVERVLKGAASAHILHFACHGHQDQHNPLNSGFDLDTGRLTLGQLMRVSTPQAQLAYLSACESAGRDEGRPDEGLNLASTMIFVGFKSVIGTMWEMNDTDGPFMAKRIYSRIFQNGALDMSAVPYAVDDAVRELRESGVPASRWATYVHFGV